MLPPPPKGKGDVESVEPPNGEGAGFGPPKGDGEAPVANGDMVVLAPDPDPKKDVDGAEPNAEGVVEAKGDVVEGVNNEGLDAGKLELEAEEDEPKVNGLVGGAGGVSTAPLNFVGEAAAEEDVPKPAKAVGGAGILRGAAVAADDVAAGGAAPNGDGAGAVERAASAVGRLSNSFCTSVRLLLYSRSTLPKSAKGS